MKSDDINVDDWYPDSDATNHVTNSLQNLSLGNKSYSRKHSIQVGNGETISISHIGNGYISTKRHLYFNNLLRVPNIKKNPISVSQFANDNNVYFEFHPKFCLVKDLIINKILL